MLQTLAEIADSLFRTYQPEALKDGFDVADYEASLKPMTAEELVARAKESDRAIEAGEYVDIEEALAELGG
ncbi:MAG: hypothetical protein AAF741_05530 [Bacteroidota bacterium]